MLRKKEHTCMSEKKQKQKNQHIRHLNVKFITQKDINNDLK